LVVDWVADWVVDLVADLVADSAVVWVVDSGNKFLHLVMVSKLAAVLVWLVVV